MNYIHFNLIFFLFLHRGRFDVFSAEITHPIVIQIELGYEDLQVFTPFKCAAST